MRCRVALPALALLTLAAGRAPAADQPPQPGSFTKQVAPLLKQYCTGCHGGAKPRGGLALDAFRDDASAAKSREVWDRVLKNVRAGDMPPAKKPRPTAAEVDTLAAWVEATFARVDCGKIDPGRPTIRRLNRVEYNNTIRDLTGVDFQPAEDFPADDVGNGFDNIGDVLSLPPILLEKYLAAAEKITDTAFKTPALRKRIMISEPSPQLSQLECSRKIVENFARRGYRRPVGPEEVDRLVRFVRLAESQGDGFERGIELAVEAVLVSPHFLFRVELDPVAPRLSPAVSHPVSDYELATRLSYFLWSTMPDEELFARAKDGTLHKPDVLEAQVRRMLQDPKAQALIENFGDQWLGLRNLRTMTPDPAAFPGFDEPLRSAMLRETELFFGAIVREDRSILDFLDADFTFVNARLAKHYGIPGVQGEQFQRVKPTDGRRGGLLTQASVLTVTSNPTRTSPVKRGKWILENILNAPPPPPPPNVPELKETKLLSGTLRQRMEQHRANPSCASCHARMDPLGFCLENYDAVGAWRTTDGGLPIDPSGTLPGGQSLRDPAELKAVLKGRAEEFGRCLAEKILTYALGRGLEPADKCTVDQVVAALGKGQYKFSRLVLEIVKSESFQKRRGKRGNV
jgi:mono/diheme cytochrome c family protein